MKLRIKGASLRVRLTQAEVRTLERDGQVEEHVPFAARRQLTYRLRRDPKAARIHATLEGGVVEICLPEALAREWCAGDQVTLAERQVLPEGALQITIEKDFACLAPRSDEDESDNFPHPQAGSGKNC